MNEKAFVIGYPIKHSRSPVIHNYWLQHHNIDASYRVINVAPEQLSGLVADLRSGKYVGGNITIPHKVDVCNYCDVLSPGATMLGAVNTVYMRSGVLHGDNTDGYGFLSNLDQQVQGWDNGVKTVLILGAGGATRAIIVALLERQISQVIILNRTLDTAKYLAQKFANIKPEVKLLAGGLDEFSRYAPQSDLLINTSAVGLNNTKFVNLDISLLPKHAMVTDIVYTPMLTPLLLSARDRGLNICDGLGMLLHQAVPGFEKWFGIVPKVTPKLRQLVIDDLEKS